MGHLLFGSIASIQRETSLLRVRLPSDGTPVLCRYDRVYRKTEPEPALQPKDPGHLKLNPSLPSTSAQRPASALRSIRVAIVIASKLERLGWSIVVDGQQDMAVAGQFSSLAAALVFLSSHDVDVALVDEALLTPSGWDALGNVPQGRLPRLLLLARHPAENPFAEARHPLILRRLLKGLPAAELLAAIREAIPPGGGTPESRQSNGSR